MSGRSPAWRGVAAFVLAVCGGALWLGGAGALQAAQRVQALSQGQAQAPAFACAFRAKTGQPCPGCGGTEAFGHAARGRWRASVAANPLGAFAGAAAWALALAAGLTLAGAGAGWLRAAGLAAAVLLPAALAVNGVVWWMSLPPGAW